MSSLSFRYICAAVPIWRRLLMSFVAFARSKALVRAGTASRGQDADGRDYDEQLDQGESALEGKGNFWSWILWVRSASYCAWARSESEKEPQKQDCLTRHLPFVYVDHARQEPIPPPPPSVPDPSRGRNPHRRVYLRTWLRRLPAFR